METLLVLAGVAVIIALAVGFSKSRWKTIATAKGGQAEELEMKNAYLKSQHVRSRVKSDGAAAAPAAGFAAGTIADNRGADSMLFRLEVSSKDLEKAESLLDQFERERRADEEHLHI